LEKGLMGMRVGGKPKLWISPHLAHGEVEVPGLIPPSAVLICDVELISVDNLQAENQGACLASYRPMI